MVVRSEGLGREHLVQGLAGVQSSSVGGFKVRRDKMGFMF